MCNRNAVNVFARARLTQPNNSAAGAYLSMEEFMTRPARYLLGTIVVGILVLALCGLALRRPPTENPFDQPAAASPNP
jgi:hypothetical protein